MKKEKLQELLNITFDEKHDYIKNLREISKDILAKEKEQKTIKRHIKMCDQAIEQYVKELLNEL
jgi:hypothetical protein